MKKIRQAIAAAVVGAAVVVTGVAAGTAVPAVTPLRAEAATAMTETATPLTYDRGNFNLFWSNGEGVLDTWVDRENGEKYDPDTRRWNGLPTVAQSAGGRLWAAWMTGGCLEPDKYNYNVLYYSDDGGKTWAENFLIIENDDVNKSIYDPELLLDNQGRFWLYIMHGGANAIQLMNPDCEDPATQLELGNVSKVIPNNLSSRPCILSEKWDNLWISPAETGSPVIEQKLWASANGTKWTEYSSITTKNTGSKRWSEGQIVELKSGKLMYISRLEGGTGLEVAYSNDGGRTWSSPETDLEAPLIGPHTKWHAETLDDGGLLFINNLSTTAREKLTAWLSYDEGKTWPYSLKLDWRPIEGFWGSSYANACQMADGKIYAVWDVGRDSVIEIGSACFTVADIKAGRIVTDGCWSYKPLVRNSNYFDVESVTEQFDKELTVELGTTRAEIAAAFPTTLHVRGSNGTDYTLNGVWKCDDFKDEYGEYVFSFVASNAPARMLDSYGKMQFVATIPAPKSKDAGCGGAIGTGIGGAVVLAGAGAVLAVRKKRDNGKSRKSK